MAKKEKISGIYVWTNTINNKKYVGCSINIYSRWGKHEQLAKSGFNRKFYNAIRKYGINNFKKEIIEIVEPNKTLLKSREDYYINLYDSIKSGYNIEKQYNTITGHPNYDKIVSNISNKAKLRKWVNNGKENLTISPDKVEHFLLNGWKFGRLQFTSKHRESLSKSHKGLVLNEKQKKAWCSGRPHSQETKDNMSKKLKGRYSIQWYIEKYGETIGREKHDHHHQKNTVSGKIVFNNGIKNKCILPDEIDTYVNNGWKKGKLIFNKNTNFSNMRNKVWVTNGTFVKKIKIEELDDYIHNGWKRGRK
jgi:group I intron endonuclease